MGETKRLVEWIDRHSRKGVRVFATFISQCLSLCVSLSLCLSLSLLPLRIDAVVLQWVICVRSPATWSVHNNLNSEIFKSHSLVDLKVLSYDPGIAERVPGFGGRSINGGVVPDTSMTATRPSGPPMVKQHPLA